MGINRPLLTMTCVGGSSLSMILVFGLKKARRLLIDQRSPWRGEGASDQFCEACESCHLNITTEKPESALSDDLTSDMSGLKFLLTHICTHSRTRARTHSPTHLPTYPPTHAHMHACRSQRTSFLLFAGILLCMVWHDTSKWWRLRRSKAKRECKASGMESCWL